MNIRFRILLRNRQLFNDFTLPVFRHLAIAQEGGHHAFMPQILAPCFEILRRFANLFTETSQGVAETVRIEVWQSGFFECFPENLANWCGGAPMLALQSDNAKLLMRIDTGFRHWKQ